MVKFVPAASVLNLRSKILRNGLLAPNACRFDTDEVKDAFHLAKYVDEEEIAGVVSFFPNALKDVEGLGYQLRGMATDEPFRGKGYGKDLVNFGVHYIRNTSASHIWCNAREVAVNFYKSVGFEIVSDKFDIAGIGPHYQMILKLNSKHENNR